MNTLGVEKPAAQEAARKIRVLLLDHVATLAGGAQRSLLDILRNLDRGRHTATVALPCPGSLADASYASGAEVVFVPMKRLRKTLNPLLLMAYGLSVLRVVPGLARAIRRRGVDVIHANGSSACLYGVLAGRLTGVPVVWHCRDLAALGLPGRMMYRMASVVVAISRAVAEHVSLLDPAPAGPGKVRLVYNGVDAAAYSQRGEGPACRQELGIAPGKFVVGMIGQIVPWKNHGIFLEAARRIGAELPQAHFLVIGDDMFGEHAGLLASLEHQVAGSGLTGRVTFAGFREDVGRVLQSLDVLVHPADREPFGRVIVEAMATGVPVVAVGRGGPAEIIAGGETGVLTREADPGELAAAVLRLARDPAEARRIAAAAVERARSGFPLASCVRGIEKIYAELAGAGPGA